MLFGDFSYYWIADREYRSFERLNELYAANGQIGFLVQHRSLNLTAIRPRKRRIKL